MELNVYQTRAKAFLGDKSLEDQLINGVLGLTGEAGEVADLVKKHRHHSHDWDRNKFLLELGDCLFYLGSLADEQGATLEEVAMLNLEKLIKRYPSGKFKSEESINRKEYKVLPDVPPVISTVASSVYNGPEITSIT